MATILSMLKKFEQLNTDEIAVDSIDATKDEIKVKQKDQLLHGLRPDGSKIGKYRSNKYATKKYALNPLAGIGNVDLKLTGDLHREIFVDVRDNTLVIDSADEKTGSLINKYGDPFGLGSERRAEYINETLRKVFIDNIKKVVSL